MPPYRTKLPGLKIVFAFLSAATKLFVLGLLILLSTNELDGIIPIISPGSNISMSSVRFLTAVNVIPDVTTAEVGEEVCLTVN